MIKLKEILLESTAPDIFVPRRLEDRLERMISLYVKNGSKGDLDLSDLNLTKLPEILKNISVDRDFFCGNNNLTSLENCPKTVGGSFYCGHNKLTSLDGATEYVGGSFYCSYNNLTSLTGAPKFVGENFGCNYNNLTSLTGAPKSVGRDFGCSYNNLTSLTGAPKSVGRDFYCRNNNVQFTREQVRAVCDVKGKIIV
jgi:Leucine-rich repeat (LRR) protein